MDKIKAGIIGGAGYTGGELIRLLLHHPQVEVAFVHSKSFAGKPIYEVHRDLYEETELHFSDSISEDIDVLFMCVAHGESKEFFKDHQFPSHVKIIDLSQDYRLKDPAHSFVYGLPELNKSAIVEATHIANPGCFATCIQLASKEESVSKPRPP